MCRRSLRFAVVLFIVVLLTGMVAVAIEPNPEDEPYLCPTGCVYRPEPCLVRSEGSFTPFRLSAGEEPEKEKVYKTLLEGCLNHHEYIDISKHNIHPNDFEEFFDEYYYNFCMLYPEALVLTAIDDATMNYAGTVLLSIKPCYLFQDKQSADTARELLNTKIHEYCDGVPEDATPLEQLFFIHDKLAADCAYSTDAADKATNETFTEEDYIYFHAYGIFADETAVCQGYAQAFYAIAKKIGFEVDYCYNDGHIWNYVKLNGAWYHLDVTHDDPLPDAPGLARHKYFLCSDTSVSDRSHSKPWETAMDTLPNCDSTAYERGYLFNFNDSKMKAITKEDGYYQFTYNGYTFSSDRLWTGNVLVTRPQNGMIWYTYLQEPEKPMTIYTAQKDADGVLRSGDASLRSGETMYEQGLPKLRYYILPAGTAKAPFGTIYFRDADTQAPCGPTLSF